MKLFLKSIIMCTVVAASQSAFAAKAIPVSYASDLDQLLRQHCDDTTVNDIRVVELNGMEKIGWSGGEAGKLLSKVTEDLGGDSFMNATEVNRDLPKETRAMIFSVTYRDSDNISQLVFNKITVNLPNDKLWTAPQVYEVEQSNYGTIMICFDKGENPLSVHANVSHREVDGSRPEVGVTAYQDINVK